jgi:hypothetical protein
MRRPNASNARHPSPRTPVQAIQATILWSVCKARWLSTAPEHGRATLVPEGWFEL